MFRKISLEESRQARKELSEKFAAEDARIKLMIDKIEDQIQRGFINNEFIDRFITSIKSRVRIGLPLTQKQISKLEEIFENN